MPRIKFKTDKLTFEAELLDTVTAAKLLAILPCESSINTWGDEIYFAVPLTSELEDNAAQVVAAGTVGFWTEGQCLAIPFGPTPISQGDECRLAARVNILGHLTSNEKQLGIIRAGETIQISLAE